MKSEKNTVLVAVLAAVAALLVVGLSLSGGGSSQQESGKALVGGHFELTDNKGRQVTEKDYRGKYLLVYFGYTHCPEICPMSLQAIADGMQRLGKVADEIVPLFITVDPERDTVEQINDYVSNFDPRTVGLTGTKEEVAGAIKAYRIYSKRVETENAIDFDHSAIIFFMDRDGNYITHFAYGTTGDEMATKILEIFKKREPQILAVTETGN